MKTHSPYAVGRAVVCVVLLGAIAWLSWDIITILRVPSTARAERYALVHVQGNVDRPGTYRVPEGTSGFELLKTAGVRATSDVSAVAIDQELSDRQTIHVGSLSGPAGLHIGRLFARLELAVGAARVRSSDGTESPQSAGAGLRVGETVITDSSSQLDLSLGAYSRVSLDRSTELTMMKTPDSDRRQAAELSQNSGRCWYRIVYTAKGERVRISVDKIIVTPAGNGADFLVSIEPGSIKVHALDGILLVERSGGEETLNLMAGQSLSVFGSRPFLVAPRPSDISPDQIFAALNSAGQPASVTQAAPVTFVFCTLPSVFYYIDVRFDTRMVHVVALPAETSVEPYAQGFTTLAEACLIGGPVYVQSLAEQILGVRIDRYAVLIPGGLQQIVRMIGRINVDIDRAAGDYMGLSPGKQAIEGEQVVTFLKPKISGAADSRARQQLVMRGLFDQVRTGNLAVSAALAERLTSVMQTNFTISDIVSSYTRFSSVSGWTFNWRMLPGAPEIVGRRTLFVPDRDAARRLVLGN